MSLGMDSEHNLEVARQYLAALESGDREYALSFFAKDVIQQEFPNRLMPQGATRDLAGLREAANRGASVMTAQTYEILNELTWEDKVAVEVQWTGTLAIALGSLPIGGQMRARFAIFLQFRDGKILRQNNYDCFEPW